ncbi:aldehyde dehydrogenase family protein [Salinicoccus halodurans]|uniref:Acyl-CoA reductase n=1 Tax=Salinicoccus halodurans TaxID=407035 RepID=A0A0F7HKA6_9STAP|nr:aldehyde dehydrogenase family protein [Salinicoccus halodurans]AKG73581.1 aldehyde dehydrogenase [Salinicoccus halodurans]SFK52921.1 Acyl-CoA reductase [Salinicoccus halodurans]
MGATNNEPHTVEAYINGEVYKSGEHEPRVNPAKTDETAGYWPLNTVEDARRAIDAADAAFGAWRKTEMKDRIERMKKGIQKIKDNQHNLAELLSREHGKPLYDAEGELTVSIMFMEYAAENAERVYKEEINEDERGKNVLRHEPIGVVSAISPWNYPLALSTEKIAPALLAGNTMVLKPSPMAPLTVTEVTHMIAEEFPAGVLNIVHGDADVGIELTSNDKVRKIAFTGGTNTGKHIMKAAAETIKNVTLELGGNDPAIFLDDFDVNDEAAMRRVVISNFLTGGQICMIAKRMYVHESIYDQFIEKYIEAANKWLRIGDPTKKETTVGPVNNKNQLEFVQSLLDDSKKQGYEIKQLGKVDDEEFFEKGYFMYPTIVLGADYDSRIVAEEQFGPTVPILKFKDDAQAIELANDSELGLTSSVWGEEDHAIEVSRHIEAGVTMVNTAAIQGLDIRFPFGGVKQSGIGREYGEEGMLEYVDSHVINIPATKDLPNIPQ